MTMVISMLAKTIYNPCEVQNVLTCGRLQTLATTKMVEIQHRATSASHESTVLVVDQQDGERRSGLLTLWKSFVLTETKLCLCHINTWALFQKPGLTYSFPLIPLSETVPCLGFTCFA